MRIDLDGIGVRGLVVVDEHGRRLVYPILEPAHQDYAVMTGSRWIPCLMDGVTPSAGCEHVAAHVLRP